MKQILIILITLLFLISCLSDPETHELSNLPNWVLVWSDEFNTPGLPDAGKWSFEVGGFGYNEEIQYYTSPDMNNAWVENGNLVIEARHEDYKGMNYTSAKLVTKDKGDWLYGRIEVRAKLPRGNGIWPAIWMMPTDEEFGYWPQSGEIDIMEQVGFSPEIVHCAIHTKNYNHVLGTQKGAETQLNDPTSLYYTYILEWYPDRLLIYVDDLLYFMYRKKSNDPAIWPYVKRFYLILNCAVGGTWGGLKGIDNSIFPQRMFVDYVRVYQDVQEVSPFFLEVREEGGGQVEFSPQQDTYNQGTEVVLIARPEKGYQFTGWSGSLSGKENPLIITMFRNTTLQANFGRIGELLINPDFTLGSGRWFLNRFNGAGAEPVVKDGMYCVVISDPGPDTWSVQLNQGNLSLKQEHTYRLRFTASASVNKLIFAGIAKAYDPYTTYTGENFTLTPEMKTYTFTWYMKEPGDDNVRVFFDMGKYKGDIFIDSISFIEIPQ